jgi:hypothetical protein
LESINEKWKIHDAKLAADGIYHHGIVCDDIPGRATGIKAGRQ